MTDSRPSRVRVLVLGMLVASACAREPQELRIDASRSSADVIQSLTERYRAEHPGERLIILTGMRSPDRISGIHAGIADIAIVEQILDTADLDRFDLEQREIARRVGVFAVHPDLTTQSLTAEQLCDIHSGSVTNWRQLGGPDLRIRAGMRPPSEDDTGDPLEPLSCGAAFRYSPEVQLFERSEELALAIGRTPGGIGLIPLAAAQRSGGTVRAIAVGGVAASDSSVRSGRYPFARPIVLVTRRRSRAGYARLLAFIAAAPGQEILRAHGMVPMLAPRK